MCYSLSILTLSACFFFVGDNHPSTSDLQSDSKVDGNDELASGRLADHNILRECPGPTSYAHKNVEVKCMTSAWHLFVDKFVSLNTSRSVPSLTRIRKPKMKNFFFSKKSCSALLRSWMSGR